MKLGYYYVYKIISDKTNKVYVGRTEHMLEDRMYVHINAYNYFLMKKLQGIEYTYNRQNSKIPIKYCTSYEIIKYGDARIKLIEKCIKWDQSKQQEIFWINNLDTVNIIYKKNPILKGYMNKISIEDLKNYNLITQKKCYIV